MQLEVLSWQFESVAERGLSREHLHMLAEKLLGKVGRHVLSWPKFSKDGAAGFSFWAWLDGILGLLQEHLKKLWKDGLILGFVSRKQEKKLLKGKRTGTFLIRFSESVLGGVTFTWVEHPESGERRPAFRAVVPYTTVELASLALPDIIRDYQLLAEENIPENPLLFLYPDTPRDEAFSPYYSQRQEGELGVRPEVRDPWGPSWAPLGTLRPPTTSPGNPQDPQQPRDSPPRHIPSPQDPQARW
uniref:SH2 domain-containing protein n=1 Tax=Anser brachyrhynchus TaxID=132585 RepID=A0A8B9C554_9AVES